MFTGLIEEIGVVKDILINHRGSALLTIHTDRLLSDAALGDSICVNGVCLTIVKFDKNNFSSHLSEETLKKTIMGGVKVADRVNLERSLKYGARVGGHLVAGHVDGVCEVGSIHENEDTISFTVKIPKALSKYFVYKGSVAVNGVSLTISEKTKNDFTVSIIPHTLSHSTLNLLKIGDRVNIECDILGKYIENMCAPLIKEEPEKISITREFLRSHGF
jgi:riboflavin synthase